MGPPSMQFGPRGPHFRPEHRPRFQGPGGPRPNQPMPLGPDGPIRGPMRPRMGAPRPLLPDMVRTIHDLASCFSVHCHTIIGYKNFLYEID